MYGLNAVTNYKEMYRIIIYIFLHIAGPSP